MTGSSHNQGDPRAACICSQATPADAGRLLAAMQLTQNGKPDGGDLVLAMVKARRHDLFPIMAEHYSGFQFDRHLQSQGQVTLAALSRALAVGVGNGEYSNLDSQKEEQTAAGLITAGFLPLDALLSLDASTRTRAMNTHGPGPGAGSCWILGKPFNPGLSMGFLRGAIDFGVDTQDARWHNLLELVAQQALERAVSTRTQKHKDVMLDCLLEFVLGRMKTDCTAGPSMLTASAVLKFHATRGENEGRWPRARAACDQVVSGHAFCRAVASNAAWVRIWARPGDLSEIMDPDIFVRAGCVPAAMGSLAAGAIRSDSKSLIGHTCEALKSTQWDEGGRIEFTTSMIKEFEWMEKYWNKNTNPPKGTTSRLAAVLGCVHGPGKGTEHMVIAISDRLKTPIEQKENLADFVDEIRSSCSMMGMEARTRRLRSAKTSGPRL